MPAWPNDASDESIFVTEAREPHASFAELNDAASCVRFAFVSSARRASKRVLSDDAVEVCDAVVVDVATVVEACVTTTFRTSSVFEEHALPASARTISIDALFARDDVFMRPPRRLWLALGMVRSRMVCAIRPAKLIAVRCQTAGWGIKEPQVDGLGFFKSDDSYCPFVVSCCDLDCVVVVCVLR